MKQKVKIAMEKILKLQEEFTEDELQEAMENLLKQIFNKEMRKSSRGKKAKIPKKETNISHLAILYHVL